MANLRQQWDRMRAARAYEDFTGAKPTKSQVAKLDSRDIAGYRMGDVVGIAYEAVRDGEKDQYFHRFSKKARPSLVARSDGRQLYITGGKYHVTDRGIEDKKMPQLFVVNPSRRRKRRASPSRRGAGGRFLPNPRRRKRSAPLMATRRRRRHRRVSFRRNPMGAYMRANPAPRRRRRRRSAMRSYRRNPIRMSRRRRHYRRNPIGRGGGGRGSINIMQMVMPAAMIGAGAVGTELLMGYMPFLPPVLTTGPQRYLTKGVLGALAGWAIAKYANRRAGEAFAMGALVIAAHDALKAGLVSFVPKAKFGRYMDGMGYYSPGAMMGPGMAGYNWDKYGYNILENDYPMANPGTNGMGAYDSPNVGGTGDYMSDFVP